MHLGCSCTKNVELSNLLDQIAGVIAVVLLAVAVVTVVGASKVVDFIVSKVEVASPANAQADV